MGSKNSEGTKLRRFDQVVVGEPLGGATHVPKYSMERVTPGMSPKS